MWEDAGSNPVGPILLFSGSFLWRDGQEYPCVAERYRSQKVCENPFFMDAPTADRRPGPGLLNVCDE